MQVELNVAEVYEKHAREHSTASEEVQTIKGWKISARQCELITLGDRSAVDKFFSDNFKRLITCARAYLRRKILFNDTTVYFLDVDELVNQVYVDMRQCFLVMDMQHISAIVFHSFRFACVGGFGDELGAYTYKPRKRIEAVQ